MKIVVVGIGALGSHVVQFLRNVEGSIYTIDFDRVEQKNVKSQFHSKPNVGATKTVSLEKAMNYLFGKIVKGSPNKIGPDNAVRLLEGSDLVLDCLDNGDSRRLVQETIRSLKIPCLHGALAANGTLGRVMWDEHFVVDDAAGAGAATCEAGEFLPFITVVSSYLALSAQEFLKSGKKRSFQISPDGKSIPL